MPLYRDPFDHRQFIKHMVTMEVTRQAARYGLNPKAILTNVYNDDISYYVQQVVIELVQFLAKQESDQLKEQKTEYTEVPASGWDYLKSLLQEDLQFGWLKPQFKRIPYTTNITIHRMKLCPHVVEDPSDRHVRFLQSRYDASDFDD